MKIREFIYVPLWVFFSFGEVEAVHNGQLFIVARLEIIYKGYDVPQMH